MAKKPDQKKIEAATNEKQCNAAGGGWDPKAKKCILPEKKKVEKAKSEKECILAGGKWDPKAKTCTMPK